MKVNNQKNGTPPKEIPNTPDPKQPNPIKDPNLAPNKHNPINPKTDEPAKPNDK